MFNISPLYATYPAIEFVLISRLKDAYGSFAPEEALFAWYHFENS
jgi:hypothetical protein